MLTSIIGFVELGGIILAWMILWNYLIRGVTAHHSESPVMQGLASVLAL